VDEGFYDVLARTEHEHWWYSARREILRWAITTGLERAPNDGVLYDLGCGVGANLDMLGALGETVGVDASERAIGHCHAEGRENVRLADLERLTGIPAASGRLVLLADVIEHLDDDRGCLEAVHGILRPSGALVVTVPAFQILWGPNDDVSQHRRRYTARSLRRVLEARFEIEKMTYFNSVLLPPIALGRWAQRLVRAKGGEEAELPRPAVNETLRRLFRSELRWLKRGGTFPAGVSLLAIARRR
jgi:SAM-dependent methyltransferase